MPVPDPNFALADRYDRLEGDVLLTGIQALTRVVMDQVRADQAKGWNTAAFVSGYPGSPLGGLDREMVAQQTRLAALGVVHQSGLNEELAATSVVGTQLLPERPTATVQGVAGYWYGKAPGLERAADAIRHANLVGTSPRGGVLALVGDDPACKSSTVPSRSDAFVAALGLPLLDAGTVQDLLDLGRHGIEMSRHSGCWTALRVTAGVADSSGTTVVDSGRLRIVSPDRYWVGLPWQPTVSGITLAPTSLEQEIELFGPRLSAAADYVRANSLNQEVVSSPDAWLGIVASGEAAEAVTRVLAQLGLDRQAASSLGIRVLKLRAVHPFDREAVRELARGVSTLLVVEDKRAHIETLVRDALYASTDHPEVIGKNDASGRPLIPLGGALTASRLIEPVRRILSSRLPDDRLAPVPRDREHIRIAVAADEVRTPFFCSGCPHSVSTRVPEGSLVGLGIGCHGMANRLGREDRGEFLGITQMGGEGGHWLGMRHFCATDHVFQNIGDGTFFHSGQLAIQAAVSSGASMTFKLLYNSAVAMTGGQTAVGGRPVADVATRLRTDGVAEVAITTDDPGRYRGVRLGDGITVHDRDRILEVQENLRSVPGVTVLIHDQECAAERRRNRKRGLVAAPATRIVIDHRICERCGDCGVQSNCLSLGTVETEFGTKTAVDQASCNHDHSCLKGDCPAFVVVKPAKKRPAASVAPAGGLPEPTRGRRDVVIRMPGIGGTGVVTVSQILLTAAKIDGIPATAVDQTGLSQKAGPVVSTVEMGHPDHGSVDLLLAFDLLTACTVDTLDGLDPEGSSVVASTSLSPTGLMISNVHRPVWDPAPYIEQLNERADPERNVFVDAAAVTGRLLGSSQAANVFLIGVAYQRGVLPVSGGAIERAIEINGTAVDANLTAYRAGRRWVHDPDSMPGSVDAAPSGADAPGLDWISDERLRATVARRRSDLEAYQRPAYAVRYVTAVRRCCDAEAAAGLGPVLSSVVAHQLYRVMAYKDEYEIARLLLSGRHRVQDALGGDVDSVRWQLQPPTLRKLGRAHKLSVSERWAPGMRVLYGMRRLRGTPLRSVRPERDPARRASPRRGIREAHRRSDPAAAGRSRRSGRSGIAGRCRPWVRIGQAEESGHLPDSCRRPGSRHRTGTGGRSVNPHPYLPSPVAMVSEQVAQFEATDGERGGLHKGLPVVILTTTGARTGALRKTPLMRVENDGRYALVATFGGSPTHPMWYRNLVREPRVSLQDGAVVRRYLSRTLGADDPELEAWWERAVRIFPAYGDYRRKLRGVRDVPMVILEPISDLPAGI
jgi:indolepyruvate ferredoxin oxidoreductase